ncbi:hypothetical protein Cpir12675_000163 [Ceratocystis pirilliformis]|uniref:Uncharacterized protein n=1 Tax=Ceratocystis pirilliformis TaxID=259994 RepID=A0ABR3ZPH9_9PEZI
MIDLDLLGDTGSQVLLEVVETSLDEVILALRETVLVQDEATVPSSYLPKKTGVPGLDSLAMKNFRETQTSPISVSGRSLPFIHALLDHLVSPPQSKTVALIDLECGFDPTRLASSRSNLSHIHVFRMPPATADSTASSIAEMVREAVARVQQWMVYGSHQSAGREWWGTIILGAPGGQVWTCWRGWLCVDTEDIPGFATGMSIREAMAERERREQAVDSMNWVASCPWGRFDFRGRLVQENEELQRHHKLEDDAASGEA